MIKGSKQCSRGSGFVMSYDCGVSGCEEYKDCPLCFGVGGFGGDVSGLDAAIVPRTSSPKIQKIKGRKIVL